MKKKSLILMIALAGLFSSCNDAIDIDQPGQVVNPEDIYKSPKDIERGVYGIYALLPGESEIEFDSVFTDEVALGIANGGQGLISGEYGFFMQPGNSFATSTWGGYYSVINQVNRLLHSIDGLIAQNPGQNDITKLNKHKAELLVLRAYSNFKLFAYFTPDYTNPSGLSIMKLDFLQLGDYNKNIGRSTVSEIKEFILSDLTTAEQVYNQAWGTNIYVTQGLIDGIRAKLFAMVGEYEKVIPAAQAVLTNPTNQIANASQYADYFNDVVDIPKEIIFQLQRVRGNASVASAWYSSSVASNGSPFFEMGRSLYNELDKLDPSTTGRPNFVKRANGSKGDIIPRNDVRYSVNLLEASTVDSLYQSLNQSAYVADDVLLIGKYKGRRSLSLPLQNNIPILRAADMYLTMAEARAAEGKFAATATSNSALYTEGQNAGSVEAIIFFIRTNRAVNRSLAQRVTITNTQEAWKAILDERRVEFAFEGHRYLDMKRLGAKAGSAGFQRYSKDAVVNGTQNGLPVSSHKMTLPIPTSELNSNPKVRGQQNPGY